MFQRTSELCALARRDSVTRAPHSTVSSSSSCAKVVTSPTRTEPVASQFTAPSLPTRTSFWSTTSQVSCPWPTLDQTPMVLSSFWPLLLARGWTANTAFSARLLRVWMLSRPLRLLVPEAERPQRRSLLLSAVNYKFNYFEKFLTSITLSRDFFLVYFILVFLVWLQKWFCIFFVSLRVSSNKINQLWKYFSTYWSQLYLMRF